MKVYDCFTFYNEFELLELRLRSLWDVVDYFVIVEANRKHTGEPKIFNFWERQDEFKDFLPKIRFVPADMSNVPFKGVGDWAIENAQRNAIMQGLVDAEPDDLILISDLDEIPNPEIFPSLSDNRLAITGFYITPPRKKRADRHSSTNSCSSNGFFGSRCDSFGANASLLLFRLDKP